MLLSSVHDRTCGWRSALLVVILALATCTTNADSSVHLHRPNSPISSSSFASKQRRLTRTAATTTAVRHDEITADHSAATLAQTLRAGGMRPGFTPSNLVGAACFCVFDIGLRKVFTEKGIEFPSMLAGTIIIFVSLLFSELVKPGLGESVFQLLNPGATLLAKWLPVFFVPGLALLPLAPSFGSGKEVAKVLLIVTFGWLYTILTTTYAVLGVRTLQGKIEPRAAPVEAEVTADVVVVAPAAKPFSEETVRNLSVGVLIFGLLSTYATRTSNFLAIPLTTLLMTCTTVGSFVYGARMPKSFTAVIHPLVTSTAVTLAVTRLSAMATGQTFDDVLRTYKSGSLSPMKGGAGDFLLFLLGPSVVSLSTAMYSRKQLMKENLSVILLGTFVSAAGGLFGTAFLARLLNVASGILRRSILPRNVTTALAMAISTMLEGNISITASVVVMTGIFGGTFATRFLTFLNIQDPVTRGLATGCSSQGLGVASIVGEADAFPFAAIGLVLTAIVATCLTSVAPIKDVILKVAGVDTVKVVAETVVEAVAEAVEAVASEL